MSRDLAGRRRVLAGIASLALASSCRSRSSSGSAGGPAGEPPPATGAGWREVTFEATADEPEGQRALLYGPPGTRDLPLLITLHGRGESGRGLDVGARAWRDDYLIDRLLRRLEAPPLAKADLGGFVTQQRLALLNNSLSAQPFKGLCLACPYTPDLPDKSPKGADAYARFLVDRLLPRARTETGAATSRDATGIDGVSMGGRLALLVGLARPDIFGAVGALQPALKFQEGPMFSELARAAMEKHPVLLRLVSSEADPFLPAIRAVSDRMRADGVPHELLVTPGRHDYDYNRGTGGAEMLLWHERVQRGLPAP